MTLSAFVLLVFVRTVLYCGSFSQFCFFFYRDTWFQWTEQPLKSYRVFLLESMAVNHAYQCGLLGIGNKGVANEGHCGNFLNLAFGGQTGQAMSTNHFFTRSTFIEFYDSIA